MGGGKFSYLCHFENRSLLEILKGGEFSRAAIPDHYLGVANDRGRVGWGAHNKIQTF
jgi:hypothetical protein